METIPRTPERLARGKYLVEGVLQCFACHSEVDFTQRPLQLKPGTKGGGHIFANIELDLPEPNQRRIWSDLGRVEYEEYQRRTSEN